MSQKYLKPFQLLRGRGFQSIQTAILFWFSSIIITALIVFLLISLNFTERTVVNNSSSYTMQLIEQVNSDIDSYIEYMQNISLVMSSNSDIQNYISKNFTTSSQGTLEWFRIANQFNTIMNARPDVYNIGLISNDGRYVLNSGTADLNKNIDLDKLDWYQEAISADGATILTTSHVQTLIKDDYKWVITLANTIADPLTKEPSGMFFIDLNYKSINDLCKGISLGSKGYVFIISADGEIIYHPKQQLLYSGLKQEEIEQVLALDGENGTFIVAEGSDAKLYTSCTSSQTGWTVVGVSYMSELIANKQQTQEVYLIVAILLLFLTLILSILLSSRITKPVKALQRSMSIAETGNFEAAVIDESFMTEEKSYKEIKALNRSFNTMTDRIQDLMEQNVNEQKQIRKSELMALQAQINPHFLYNTLDSIIWMSELGNNDEVVLMTSSLARLLRKSISNENEIVTIEEELDYTRTYLTIQKMRYKDKLEFYIDVDDEILSYPIVKLILQPLVENALYHGIKYKEGIGIIYISGEPEEGCIALHIDDNGIGMDSETLLHIFEKDEASTKHNGVAVNNIQSRLQLYYGSDFGLSFESEPGKGTIATIRIPYSEKKENEHEA
ncbi:MAG: sensor histidine kinase [Lachnospiraceae bacterium]